MKFSCPIKYIINYFIPLPKSTFASYLLLKHLKPKEDSIFFDKNRMFSLEFLIHFFKFCQIGWSYTYTLLKTLNRNPMFWSIDKPISRYGDRVWNGRSLKAKMWCSLINKIFQISYRISYMFNSHISKYYIVLCIWSFFG